MIVLHGGENATNHAARMNTEAFKAKIPAVNRWIDDYMDSQKAGRSRVVDAGFPNLERYFGRKLLSDTYFLVVEKIETPPLGELGLEGLSFFEDGAYSGITYKNCYFVTQSDAGIESLHFHELIHVIQWDELGPEEFILTYGLGLLHFGYREAPLEATAYELQAQFDEGREFGGLEAQVMAEARNAAAMFG